MHFPRDPLDSNSLSGNDPRCISVDSNGDFWICDKTIARMDMQTGKLKHYKLEYGPGQLYVNTMLNFDNSRIFYNSGNMFGCFDKKKGSVQFIRNLPGTHCISRDRENNVWISCNEGFYGYNPVTGKFFFESPRDVGISGTTTGVIRDKKGFVWVTQWNNGFYKVDIAAKKYRHFTRNSSAPGDVVVPKIIDNTFTSIMEYFDHILLTDYNTALVDFDPEKESVRNIIHDPYDRMSLPAGRFYGLYKDEQLNLWVLGSWGLSKMDPGRQFIDHHFIKELQLPGAGEDMLGILPDKLGNIWIGTYTGPKIFDLESKRLMPVNKMIGYMKPAGSEEAIYCIKDDKKGGLYLGGHLLTHITDIKKARNGDVSFKWDTLRLPLNNVFAGIRDVLPVGNNLWLASDNKGLFRYNTITKTLTNYASVKDDSTTISYNGINKLFLDSKGRLWIATFHGLSVMDTLTGKIRRIYIDGERDLRKSQTQFVGGIAEDSTGKIWVATRYASLWVMDNSGTFTLFNKLHSFEPLCVWDILKAPNGKLWLNTGSGLCSLDPVTYSSVLFKQVDGFVNTPELGDMKIDRNGILYVGDDGYLHLVNTWNERPVSEVPKMHITSVMANGNSVPLKDYNNIKIRYEQNRVQFEFVGVRYANSKGVQYRYMLEGYDKNWIMNASKRYATYTNLPPGNYEFRVMAAGEDMKWWDCSEKVKITILTPWYMAWWFYLICAALLVGGPYAIYRYRLNNILKLQKIRLNIAADLHDEVGSTLSSISMLSQVAEKKSADGNTRQLLKQISENSSEIQESMSDIVWSINPNNDELANILARMRIFASELLEPLDIDFSFEVNEEAYSVSLPMSLRKDFYLIFKEAVNNAAKYAHCAAVTVSLRVKNKKLQMVIADNGIGIPANSGSANGNGKHRGNGGNGMKNMEIRAAKMGGNIEIVNGEAGGTKVVLEIPIVT